MKLNKIEKRKKFFVFSLLPMTAKSKMRLESNYWVKANEGTISCNMILEQISLIIFLFKPVAYCPKIIKRRMPLNILLLLVQTRVTKEKSFKSFYANILKRKEYVIYSDDR